MRMRFIQPQVSTKGLIGHWKLHEGTAFDYSIGGKTGTESGTTYFYDYPGIDLAGADEHIIVSDHADFSPVLTAFSVSGWINMDTGATANFIVASKGVLNTKGEWLFYSNAASKIALLIIDETGNPPVADCYIGRYYNTALSANTWYHVACTYSGGTTSAGIKVYLDGTRVDDTNGQNNQANFVQVRNDTADVHIGRYGAFYSNGTIDDVMIFNVEKSAAEIKSIYEVTRRRYNA